MHSSQHLCWSQARRPPEESKLFHYGFLRFVTLMLTNVYVDGFNLYYGCSRARRTSGWTLARCAKRCCHRTRSIASVTSRPRSVLKRTRKGRCARPPTSGTPDGPRVDGAAPPSPVTPGSGCLQLHPTATTARRCPVSPPYVTIEPRDAGRFDQAFFPHPGGASGAAPDQCGCSRKHRAALL